MKQKKVYLEAIRIFAIFFVIYIHTGVEAAEHYRIAENNFSYLLSLVLYAFAEVSVPLFFMISGALLLHKEESLRFVLTHRALRIFILIITFGFLQFWYANFSQPEISFSIPIFTWTLYSTTIITQYWYLYAYFTLMLILPFVRMLARSMQNSHFWYLFGLYFMLEGLFPILEFIWGNNRIALSIPILSNIILYPLMGYYIVHRSGELFYKRKILMAANLVAIAALVTNTVVALMAHRQRGAGETLDGMTGVLAVITFINFRAIFYAMSKSECKLLNGRFARFIKNTIVFIGGGVFGVYLLEPQLRDGFKFIYTTLEPGISWFPATIIWIATAIICGCILFNVVKKIPILRKLF